MMNTSRVLCTAFVIGSAVVVGCRHDVGSAPSQGQASPLAQRPQSAVSPQSVPQGSKDHGTKDADAAPEPGTARALAQKANVYARDVEPMLSRRPEKGRQSKVQWPDPDDLHLTAHEAAAEEERSARAKAPSDLNDEANVAAITPAAAGQDHTGAAPADAQASIEGTVVPTHAPAPAPATSTDALAQRFEQRVKDYPQDVAGHVDYQLLKFLQEESVPLIPVLTPLSAEDRELVSALMDSLSNLRTTLRSDENVLFGKKIRPLIDLADRLRGQAELSIPTVALCNRVTNFGNYEPFEKDRFVAGKPHDVVVYCEVENFSTQLNDKKMWETRLNEEIVLYTESQGLPVWSDKKKNYIDISHTRRHDFFTAKIIQLPANLTIGRYLLKVSVEDQQVKRIAENTIPIEIVAE